MPSNGPMFGGGPQGSPATLGGLQATWLPRRGLPTATPRAITSLVRGGGAQVGLARRPGPPASCPRGPHRAPPAPGWPAVEQNKSTTAPTQPHVTSNLRSLAHSKPSRTKKFPPAAWCSKRGVYIILQRHQRNSVRSTTDLVVSGCTPIMQYGTWGKATRATGAGLRRCIRRPLADRPGHEVGEIGRHRPVGRLQAPHFVSFIHSFIQCTIKWMNGKIDRSIINNR